ncbi:hypothetical protein J2747_001327 [Thermococcus stetteri]|nr:hypothetical protein [Thermococcus stetteri]
MRWYAVEIGKLSYNNVIAGNVIEDTQDDGVFI